jgi:xylulokinase
VDVSETYLLGIDLGTTTGRAAIFTLDGTEVSAAYREMPVQYPRPLWAQVDPEEWWDGITRVVREAIAKAGIPPSRIAAIGLSGLMHAPVLLDGDGRPVAPAMLWMDQRCGPQVEALRRDYAAHGINTPFGVTTGVSAPKLRWIAEAQPDVMARARVIVLPKDFIRYRLTDALGTDPSDAGGTGLFDRERGDWAWEMVRLTGTPRELMPKVDPSVALAGRVTAEAAQATGLAEGTPVAVGGADTLCTRLGVGILEPDEVCMYLGTAAWITQMGSPLRDGSRPLRGFGATSTTGAALRWVRDLFASTPDESVAKWYETLTRPAAEVEPGAEGLLFLPHLMGERGPWPDPLAQGALVGLTLRHGRPDVVRAVLEGTAFQLRRLIEARMGDGSSGEARPRSGVACGGAARSSLWMQVIADVTRLALRVPAVVEAGVLGAAMLGGAAVGLLELDSAPAQMVRIARTFEPVPSIAARYDDLYDRYCRLDDLLMPWFHQSS